MVNENENHQKISCKLSHSTKSTQDLRDRVKIRLYNGNQSPKLTCDKIELSKKQGSKNEIISKISNTKNEDRNNDKYDRNTTMDQNLTQNISLDNNKNNDKNNGSMVSCKRDNLINNSSKIQKNGNTSKNTTKKFGKLSKSNKTDNISGKNNISGFFDAKNLHYW